MQVMIGNLGGVMSAYTYVPKDAPHYRHGHAGLVGLNVFACLASIGMTLALRAENSRRDQAYKKPSEYTAAEKEQERQRGDNATFFRYTV